MLDAPLLREKYEPFCDPVFVAPVPSSVMSKVGQAGIRAPHSK
jgi:hypothetical protein